MRRTQHGFVSTVDVDDTKMRAKRLPSKILRFIISVFLGAEQHNRRSASRS